jgi:hypothetical protein
MGDSNFLQVCQEKNHKMQACLFYLSFFYHTYAYVSDTVHVLSTVLNSSRVLP